MMFAVNWSSVESACWSALAQLIVISLVGVAANIIYRRFRDLSTARQELLEDIDQFSLALYTPRKLYQVVVDRAATFLGAVGTPEERERRRLEAVHRCLEELVAASGRFRTLQVEIIRLYGYNMELLSHYLAVWRYLKEIRRRMEKCESLYFPGENSGSDDAFYKLFDTFRFRVSIARFVYRTPSAARPPDEVLVEMRKLGDEVFQRYFATAGTAQ